MSIAEKLNSAEALSLQLTPRGHLLLVPDADGPVLPADIRQGLANAFAKNAGHGLFNLGSMQVGTVLPPVLAWWRDIVARYVTALCAVGEGGDTNIAPPDTNALEALIADAPPMLGAEYLTSQVLSTLWSETANAFHTEWMRPRCHWPTF